MQPDEHLLCELLHDWGVPLRSQAIGGGCISQSYRVSLRSPSAKLRDVFVKRNTAGFFDNFECERQGLEKLAEVEAIRVPRPLKLVRTQHDAWLVTEWIEAPPHTANSDFLQSRFYELLGTQLATLHRLSSCQHIGFERDNYLGAARQINTPVAGWIEFVGQHRLGFQLQWASEQGLADRGLQTAVQRIIDDLPVLLEGRQPVSTLLHGDLWSGNYLADSRGQPVIIDPAVYYGCREAEFGMLQLFGNCPAAFYAAYQAAYPLPVGWQRRSGIYQLYHLLNHLNLFGASYLGACHELASSILRA